MYQQKNIGISDLHLNTGQVEGLPKNPRFIRDERFGALKKSIADAPEMLQLRELLVYDHYGEYVIIAGNMRYRAGKELGLQEFPCKILPTDTPVEKLREYTIKDNIAFGQNDWAALNGEWQISELLDWGFDEAEWQQADFSTEDTEPTAIETDVVVEDDFSEEDEQNVPKRVNAGEMWRCGDHLLLCGDSTNKEDLRRLTGGVCVDMLLTDPPYNVNYNQEKKKNSSRENTNAILNDNLPDSDFHQFLVDAFAAASDVMKGGAAFYIWHSDSEGYNFRGACRDIGWTVRQCLIWNKNQSVMGRQDYQWKHEPCLYGWKDGAAHRWFSDRCQTTVIDFQKPQTNKHHPTMKPIGLFGYLVQNSTKEGDIVLDSFGGSGTCMLACEQLNRKARLMELDPHYCDVIIARWEQMTGKHAEKL